MKKRIISSILTVIMLMTMLPTAALAAAAPGTSSGTVIYVSESGDDSAAGDENAPLKTIGAAFTKAADGDTICLLSDIQLVGKLVLTGDKSVTLVGKADETAKKITYQKDTSTDLYMIEVGVEYGSATTTKLTLENVTVDAEEQDIRCIRVCPESQLTLENGATVCNGRAVHRRDDHSGNTGTNDWGGGIVVDSTAKLIMNDGSAVTDCSAEQGGGIYLSGEMELNGGTISGNTAVGDYFYTAYTQSAHGGAILIRANRADYDESYDVPAKLTMTGGSIQNNKAASTLSAFGGAVAILGTPKKSVDLTNEFIMTGGTISSNTAGYGGAISVYAADRYWNGNASVKISGNAEITQNIGRNGGGAIALWTSKADDYTSTVEMSGGTFSENETFSKGGGVFLYGKGDSFYMTDGKISDNEAKQGGGISISDTDAAAYLLGGTIRDNKATDGYPYVDDPSERCYYGNAVYQDGSLYLDGTKANISGDIRIGCRFDTSGGISTNRFVALVGASDTMNDYELTSFDSESLDGRVVVAPDTITYGTETYSVADAEPYLSHFTHNHKEIITDTDYTAETGTSSQAKSLVLYGAIQKFSVTYTDGIGGTSFADEVTSDLRRGTPTPAFTGGTPTRSGYTFTGWEPSVAATVTGNAVYTAQWTKNSSSSHHHSTRYTLHYESNGGTSYKDESYSSGTTVTLDKAPVRESYTFTGWYADKALTDKITNVKMTGNKTVYAGWKATGVPDMLNGDDHYAYVVGYSDGTVRPNANISRAEVATIFFRLLKEEVRDGNLTAENTFADVTDGQWHNKAISTMAKLGVVKGRNAEAFDPDAPITRAEFATICARFDKTQINTSSNFTDISGHWAEKYIERAATLGWIAGYSDGTFRPSNYITRAEAMTMINRVLCRMPQSEDDLLHTMVVWPDNKPTDWHYLAVQEATNSHEFARKGAVNETWTKLTSAPDWTRYQ
ncbi:S-layer homology domain-containing protein [Evtepia sp.]|uniref:S-layer homology domain-containing protein n=1 Tax=Evtepia sp. TaxID=2773933 RepID=UPI002E76035A|nr:S-layer homology domain-containing protein [Evtepia sp.]MEE0256303.1 S-layer homology domain-containing protein [Evtepia sp.]